MWLLLLFVGIMLHCAQHTTPEVKYPVPKPAAELPAMYLDSLLNKKIGMVVNHSSRLGERHLVDTLLDLGVNIDVLFAPEHGFLGTADAGAVIRDGVYERGDIPVISLYGQKKKPGSEDLKGLDAIVFDMQDVGVRTYTYISTLHHVMEVCAEQNIPLFILDRPNPNGFYVDGPVLEEKYKSFVGMHPVPLVHGMTIGEYARMINGEGWLRDSIQCALQIFPCLDYTHNDRYTLPVPPSPNLKNMQAIYLYPSLVLFEGTVVSVGRGTPFPFNVYGHPVYPDTSFSFLPEPLEGSSMDPKLKGRVCYGRNLSAIPADSLSSWGKLNLEFLLDMYHATGFNAEFFVPFFDRLAGTSELRKQIMNGHTEAEIRQSWADQLNAYKTIRVKYLLYPDFE